MIIIPATKKLGYFSTMPFGKYKGARVGILARDNPGYLLWCLDNLGDFRLKGIRRKQLEKRLDVIMERDHDNHSQYESIFPELDYDPFAD